MRAPKWWILVVILFLGALASIIGGAVWYGRRRALYYDAAANLPAELNAARAEALALTPADLLPDVPVADSRNAALLYQQITATDRGGPEGESFIAVAKGIATASDHRTVKVGLRKAAPLLRLAEKAAALPDCDFHRNWSLGPDLLLPEYAVLRKTARMLAAEATLQCESNRPEAALHTIWIGARMANHVARDPICIAFLVRIAIEAIMDRPLRRVMCRYSDRPDILRLVEETDRAFGPDLDVEHALRGEVMMCRICTGMVRSGAVTDGYGLNARILSLSRTTAADAYEAHSISF